MGAVTAESVAIAELVVYIPIALLAIFVVFRHGFHRQLGWIYLCIFCGIRIGGSIMEILSAKNPDNANDKRWAIILQSVGLSPLLLSTLGRLKRILSTYSSKATATSRRSKIIQLIQIPALIALILAISGGTDLYSSNVSAHSGGKTKTRVAIILFLAIYVAACIFWVLTVRDLSRMMSSQKRLFLGILLALPLIAVRLLYSRITDFGNNPKFSLIDGDAGIQLGMATIEEFIVVCMYTILGLITPRSSIDLAVGSGRVSQEAYGLATEACNGQQAGVARPHDNVPYIQVVAQPAYSQQYAGKGW